MNNQSHDDRYIVFSADPQVDRIPIPEPCADDNTPRLFPETTPRMIDTMGGSLTPVTPMRFPRVDTFSDQLAMG